MTDKKDFPKGCIMIRQVGSTVTCKPPVQGTDIDFLIYHTHGVPTDWLKENGYVLEGDNNYDEMPDFESWRKHDRNYIFAKTLVFYEKFILATELAKRFNLLKKDDRIALFQAVLYGNQSYA